MKHIIKIATRKSPLALWQARSVQSQLERAHPQLQCEIIGLSTEGDQEQSKPLYDIGGKALFVKSLQQALLSGQADCAVHCIKDMSVQPTNNLVIASVLQRHDPRDVLVCEQPHTLATLPARAVIGTSSPRRTSLLQRARPDLIIKPIRGNLQTRLNKLNTDDYDAIILAAAGLRRLGLTEAIQEYFDVNDFIPAIGQGALGIECRKDDTSLIQQLQHLHHTTTAHCIEAEQTVNRVLNGDCHSAIGAHAEQQGDSLRLIAMVASLDGTRYLEASATGLPGQAQQLGQYVADQLLQQGAESILASQ